MCVGGGGGGGGGGTRGYASPRTTIHSIKYCLILYSFSLIVYYIHHMRINKYHN